jgi:hypothetical protein
MSKFLSVIIIAAILGIAIWLAIGFIVIWIFSDHESFGIIYNLKSQPILSNGFIQSAIFSVIKHDNTN